MKTRLRNFCCSILGNLFIVFGFARRIKRRAKNGEFILSIYFHFPSKQLFEFSVQWLKKNHFVFLSQQEVLAISQERSPFPKGAVVITVDDGWQSNAENIVTIADKYKVPVTIFVSTEPVKTGNFWWPYIREANRLKVMDVSVQAMKKLPNDQREEIVMEAKKKVDLIRSVLTIDQVKEIAQSEFITIGGHTATHPVLVHCNDEKVYTELKTSKETLQSWIDTKVDSFAYPNGDYGPREVRCLKETGYTVAYTTKPDYLTGSALKKIYELPRFCVYEDISKSEAICRILGIWQRFFNK